MTETWASSIETMAEMNCVVGHVVSYRNGQMTINLVWMAQMGQLSTLAFYRSTKEKTLNSCYVYALICGWRPEVFSFFLGSATSARLGPEYMSPLLCDPHNAPLRRVRPRSRRGCDTVEISVRVERPRAMSVITGEREVRCMIICKRQPPSPFFLLSPQKSSGPSRISPGGNLDVSSKRQEYTYVLACQVGAE